MEVKEARFFKITLSEDEAIRLQAMLNDISEESLSQQEYIDIRAELLRELSEYV